MADNCLRMFVLYLLTKSFFCFFFLEQTVLPIDVVTNQRLKICRRKSKVNERTGTNSSTKAKYKTQGWVCECVCVDATQSVVVRKAQKYYKLKNKIYRYIIIKK